eukprot:CAMPEP_0184487538 /NCGR_PEP_ID=MMETSP0113_2-20130426/10175_1 /TAXON_ID=91329 /ORGANISM="Norrisiella sphaerica, Strain BC52" /LENGTH=405 /DNA_ID=CAMNT_0026869881 /DNA_START=99 /DNA_END=1316 /DNA_ORIENTATION=+
MLLPRLSKTLLGTRVSPATHASGLRSRVSRGTLSSRGVSRNGPFALGGPLVSERKVVRNRRGCGSHAVRAKQIGVLFDFDGTVGDTETPAMEVAYWELAPYFIDPKPEDLEGDMKAEWIRLNCGKPFGEMEQDLDVDRKKAGLDSVAEMRARKGENQQVMEVVNNARVRMGLRTLQDLRDSGEELEVLWDQARGEFEQALSRLARPCHGIPQVCDYLQKEGIPFAIATTSPKPRVPISVVAADLSKYFPEENIHSGESDFTPSRFKPDPSVYIKAADAIGVDPIDCIALEDSASGVGSAANAGIGLILGYVGATHIPEDDKHGHAEMLLRGDKSNKKRGADIVLWDMNDAIPMIKGFQKRRLSGEKAPHIPDFPEDFKNEVKGKFLESKHPVKPEREDVESFASM